MSNEQTPPAGDFGSTEGLGLVERLRQRRVRCWVHSTGESPLAGGYKVDSECSEAADEIERLRERHALMQGVLRQFVDRNLQYVDGLTTITVSRGAVLAARNFLDPGKRQEKDYGRTDRPTRAGERL